MKRFHYMIYALVFVNIAFIFLSFPNSSKVYEEFIENIPKGYGNYSDYDLYKTYIHKDTLGVPTFFVSVELAYIEKDCSNKNYYLADGFRIRNFYEHSDLGNNLAIQKVDFIKLSVLGDWLLIFYKLIYILVGILILFFFRGVKKGKMFSRHKIVYLQFIGIITLIFGFVSPNKNRVLEYVLREFCKIPINILTMNYLEVGNTLYVLLGIFLLTLAYFFSRGNYLEEQNDLTI